MTMDQSDNQTQIDALKDKVARLEAKLEELAIDYRKAVRALASYDELLNKHCHLLDKELADAFERIKNVELRFFPNLTRDMTHLYDIIRRRRGQDGQSARSPHVVRFP